MTAIYGIEMNFHGSQGGIFIMKKYSEMSKEELLTLKAEVVQIENPVIAFDFQTSAFGKEYEILLNSRLL